MKAPLIHLNGTSKDSLLEDIEEAYLALSNALDKLRRMSPNPRDYYPLPGDAFQQAVDEHQDRMQRVHLTQSELQKMAEAIHDNQTEFSID